MKWLTDLLIAIFGPKKSVEKPVDKPAEKPVPMPAHQTPTQGRVENPAYKEAKKYDGKSEHDSAFNKFLSGFWKLCGLPHYKTIVGSSFAWCALFIVGMNSQVGQEYIASAAAKRHMAYGQTVDWKKNGIPTGAVVQINHNFQCGSSGGNHVTFADGDCTAEELLKKDAVFAGFGGNQGNKVKRSMYPVKEICHVGWPKELPLPPKIIKSVNCKSDGKTGESTQ